jgi:hypothetical protein
VAEESSLFVVRYSLGTHYRAKTRQEPPKLTCGLPLEEQPFNSRGLGAFLCALQDHQSLPPEHRKAVVHEGSTNVLADIRVAFAWALSRYDCGNLTCGLHNPTQRFIATTSERSERRLIHHNPTVRAFPDARKHRNHEQRR